MKKFDPKNQLFSELKNHPPTWWLQLVGDKEIYIDVRKDNYIDVYYNGGGIIKELKFGKNGYTGLVHYKYLLPEKAEYIKYDYTQTGINTRIKNVAIGAYYLENLNLDVTKLQNQLEINIFSDK
jgi:hypothetical protein